MCLLSHNISVHIHNSKMCNKICILCYLIAFHEKRAKVVAELKKLQMETEPIIKIFEDEEVSKMIQTTRDGRQLFEYLTKNHGVS